MKKSILIILIINLSLSSNAQRRVKNKSNITPQDIILSLEIHNKAREDVGIPALTWSVELANDAQKYAEHLAKRNKGLVHCFGISNGESVAGNYRPQTLSEYWGKFACEIFYKEIKHYSYSKIRTYPFFKKFKLIRFKKIGHYTQMVSKQTTELGMGWAVSSTGKIYIVARYDKCGNILGEYPY